MSKILSSTIIVIDKIYQMTFNLKAKKNENLYFFTHNFLIKKNIKNQSIDRLIEYDRKTNNLQTTYTSLSFRKKMEQTHLCHHHFKSDHSDWQKRDLSFFLNLKF